MGLNNLSEKKLNVQKQLCRAKKGKTGKTIWNGANEKCTTIVCKEPNDQSLTFS